MTREQLVLAARLTSMLKEEREPHLAKLLTLLADQAEADLVVIELAIVTLDLLA